MGTLNLSKLNLEAENLLHREQLPMQKTITTLLFVLVQTLVFSQTIEVGFDVKVYKKKGVLGNVSEFTQAVYQKLDSLEFKLVFNEQKSIFKPSKQSGNWRERQIEKAARLFPVGLTHTYMYNLKTQSCFQIKSFANTDYVVQSKYIPLEWELSKTQKLIFGHKCFKATTFISRTDRLGQTEDIQVTAWYTPDFPQPFGPKDYVGLPGVILELHEGVERISFITNSILVNPSGEILDFPMDVKTISEKEFDEIVTGKSSN